MKLRVPGATTPQIETLLNGSTSVEPIWYAKHKPATPDWSRWINRPTLELWEAIALSLDLEPARYNPQGIVEEFDIRIEFALAHLTPGNLLAHVQVAARRHLTQVRLADIARLAQNYKPAWKLPPEFPREEAQQLIQDATTDAQSDVVKANTKTSTHKLPNRESPMQAEIVEAKKKAKDPKSPQSVWDALTLLAENGVGIMIGFSSDGIQYRGKKYQNDQVPDIFTKRNLSDRMKRETARSSAGQR